MEKFNVYFDNLLNFFKTIDVKKNVLPLGLGFIMITSFSGCASNNSSNEELPLYVVTDGISDVPDEEEISDLVSSSKIKENKELASKMEYFLRKENYLLEKVDTSDACFDKEVMIDGNRVPLCLTHKYEAVNSKIYRLTNDIKGEDLGDKKGFNICGYVVVPDEYKWASKYFLLDGGTIVDFPNKLFIGIYKYVDSSGNEYVLYKYTVTITENVAYNDNFSFEFLKQRDLKKGDSITYQALFKKKVDGFKLIDERQEGVGSSSKNIKERFKNKGEIFRNITTDDNSYTFDSFDELEIFLKK